MIKRLFALALAALLLTGCTPQPKLRQFNATYLELFDTVTTVVGLETDQTRFEEKAAEVRDVLQRYHRLFDIYHTYEGMNNLKTVNDQAGIAPVQVDPVILDLLRDCKAYYELTGGKVNVAMGSVLSLWHEARTAGLDDPANARLPDAAALEEAARHTDIRCLVIDEAASTVYLTDPEMSLDVGAVAKGWAARETAKQVSQGLLISVGGNVCATGTKDGEGTPWVVGVTDPDGGDYLHTLYLYSGSVVTSGDYQRTYMVEGQLYHHIIDPETRMPAQLWRAVTVVCEDSGLADALSTALFLLPMEQGQQLLEQTAAEALWVDAEGTIHYSPGFEAMIRT